MAGLWSVRKFWGCTHRCDVPPLCGRAPARALFSGHARSRFHGSCVGRPAVLDPVGWGTPPPTSPRAADRSGRRTPPPGLCVCSALRRACTERARACPRFANLAENRPRSPGPITPPTMEIEGAWGVLGSVTGAHSGRDVGGELPGRRVSMGVDGWRRVVNFPSGSGDHQCPRTNIPAPKPPDPLIAPSSEFLDPNLEVP